MYNQKGYQNYLENEVMGADPIKLVTLLYGGAIDALSAARLCLQNGDIAGRSRKISKAALIVNELALSLDHGKGGEISLSLTELYDYMARRLNEANFQQIDEPIAEVQSLLTTLLEAWKQNETCVAQKMSTQSFSGYAQAVPDDYTPLSLTA